VIKFNCKARARPDSHNTLVLLFTMKVQIIHCEIDAFAGPESCLPTKLSHESFVYQRASSQLP